jgi:hypothetical protein
MAISSSQFDGVYDPTPKLYKSAPRPLSLSSGTTGSIAQRTAWRSNDDSGGPAAYSAKTRGTTLNWDDAQPQQLPTSDKGASFGGK